MSLIPRGRPAIRFALSAAVCVPALMGVYLQIAHAQQVRSVADGVYSVAQANRGQQLYKAQCAECHGNALEGAVGTPLIGDSFLSSWSARSLSSFVDKIQKTMPFSMPGSLSRQQSADLTAYILQAGKFRSGSAELSESGLAQIAFPTAPLRPAVASSTGGSTPSLPPPEGNLAELMRAIAFPNANILFNLQIKDPGNQAKKQPGAVPFDYVEWGSTVYPGWLAVDQAAVALTETASLFLTPGRLCQNGKPVPLDRPDWKKYVVALEDIARQARRESKARNFAAFVDIAEKLDAACANCHKVYRDKGGPEGSGATRCQP